MSFRVDDFKQKIQEAYAIYKELGPNETKEADEFLDSFEEKNEQEKTGGTD